jgi:hypothetical protein
MIAGSKNKCKFVVQSKTNIYGAILHIQVKSPDKGVREFKKLTSFHICSANWFGLQRTPPFFHNQNLFNMQSKKEKRAICASPAISANLKTTNQFNYSAEFFTERRPS